MSTNINIYRANAPYDNRILDLRLIENAEKSLQIANENAFKITQHIGDLMQRDRDYPALSPEDKEEYLNSSDQLHANKKYCDGYMDGIRALIYDNQRVSTEMLNAVETDGQWRDNARGYHDGFYYSYYEIPEGWAKELHATENRKKRYGHPPLDGFDFESIDGQ